MVRTSILVALIVAVVASSAAAKYVDVRDPAVRERVVASYRKMGSEGLNVALGFYDYMQKQHDQLQQTIVRLETASNSKSAKPAPQDQLADAQRQLSEASAHLEAWRTAIDQISGQRGCTVSRLYWHTDLNEAKAAAERTRRPILSLRMLGKLTDEYSCANSRFFRTALYSNAKVSQFLRDNYVLHWQSVRPVPRVTIDFGDGRKLERTLTGNSAHHVLAADGKPLDVLPGLYSPLAFLQWLWDMRTFQLAYDAMPASQRPAELKQLHARLHADLLRRWDFDIQRLGEQRTELVAARITSALAGARLAEHQVPADPAPKAVRAAARAEGKTVAEAPILRFANLGGTWMERGMDDELWQALANLHRDDVKLDEASVAVVRKEFPAAVAMRIAITKARQEDPVLRMVRTFEDSMTLDTVRNEYLLHRQIHEQFVDRTSETGNVDALNDWVYATLFLTPSSDPWLGLAPRDVYTALENDGRTEPEAMVASRSGG
jgi:hypothetical protein